MSHGFRRYTRTARYAFAVLSVGLLTWFEAATWPLFQPTPFLPLAAGVVIAALVAGPGAGLLATLLGALATRLLPDDAGIGIGPESYALFIAFAGIGAAVSLLSRERHSSKARIRRILGGVSDGCAVLGPDWKCFYVNRAAATLVGRDPGELTCAPLGDVFPHLATPAATREVRRAMTEDIPGRFESWHAPDRRWFETNLYPSPEGVTIIVRDVTERRLAEEALRESEGRLRALLDQAIAGIAQTDAEGRFLMVNERYCEIVGRSAAELTGRPMSDITHPDDLPRNAALFDGLMGDGGNFVVEERYVRPDGSLVWVRKQVSAVRDASGTPRYGFAIVEEITERKRAEVEKDEALSRERASRSEAESANRSKDEFLAVVSHELRTPLTAILGWLRLMRMGAVEVSTGSRALETVERNADLLVRLVEDLLDVSRIVSGKLELETHPVRISGVVASALEVVRPTAEAKGIELIAKLTPDPGLVMGDPSRLEQAMTNLLSNAAKFTPPGGRIEVAVSRRNGSVEMSVADTGIGISPEFLPRVFDRFRQADSTDSRKHSGLGLGLAIARHVVERHGGTVRAESPGEGKGSTFTVSLPAPAALQLSAAAGPQPAPSRGEAALSDRGASLPTLTGTRVLLVEDEPDTRAIVTRILTWRGAEVRTCSSVAEARAALRDRTPDVLISDIGMPRESGYALIRAVRDAERGGKEHLPAIALTAYAQESYRVKAVAVGYDAHVAKPVEPAVLVRAVAALTTGKPAPAGRARLGPHPISSRGL